MFDTSSHKKGPRTYDKDQPAKTALPTYNPQVNVTKVAVKFCYLK